MDKAQPFLALRIADGTALNARLRREVLAMAKEMTDSGTHQRSGESYFRNKWLSPRKMHKDGPPALRELAGIIEDVANRRIQRDDEAPLGIVSMWVIVSQEGMEGIPHNHAGRLSVAYYVDPGGSGAESGGQICFYDRGPQEAPSHRVTPEAGLMVLFPSPLFHSVSRYAAAVPRIVVSANLR